MKNNVGIMLFATKAFNALSVKWRDNTIQVIFKQPQKGVAYLTNITHKTP